MYWTIKSSNGLVWRRECPLLNPYHYNLLSCLSRHLISNLTLTHSQYIDNGSVCSTNHLEKSYIVDYREVLKIKWRFAKCSLERMPHTFTHLGPPWLGGQSLNCFVLITPHRQHSCNSSMLDNSPNLALMCCMTAQQTCHQRATYNYRGILLSFTVHFNDSFNRWSSLT